MESLLALDLEPLVDTSYAVERCLPVVTCRRKQPEEPGTLSVQLRMKHRRLCRKSKTIKFIETKFAETLDLSVTKLREEPKRKCADHAKLVWLLRRINVVVVVVVAVRSHLLPVLLSTHQRTRRYSAPSKSRWWWSKRRDGPWSEAEVHHPVCLLVEVCTRCAERFRLRSDGRLSRR